MVEEEGDSLVVGEEVVVAFCSSDWAESYIDLVPGKVDPIVHGGEQGDVLAVDGESLYNFPFLNNNYREKNNSFSSVTQHISFLSTINSSKKFYFSSTQKIK